MKANRETQRQARQLFRLCLVDGRLDEQRLGDVVAHIIEEKPRRYLSLLTVIHRLARLHGERRRAVVETAVPTTPALVEAMGAALRQRHGGDLTVEFQHNPELLGGARVKIGDNVWDHSVSARLEALARAI